MDNEQALRILLDKGVDELHHSNTVLTSCAFLKKGALLSRGYVEKHGLPQTPQYTDEKDKRVGIWNDIFLDGVDIHYRAKKRNQYGPVLFCFDTESILRDRKTQGTLRICRDNPLHWREDQGPSQWYIETPPQLQAEYGYGDFAKSLTFRTADGTLPLAPHLKRIEVDAPERMIGVNSAFDVAAAAIKAAAAAGGAKIKIQEHECQADCKCGAAYAGMTEKSMRDLFSAQA